MRIAENDKSQRQSGKVTRYDAHGEGRESGEKPKILTQNFARLSLLSPVEKDENWENSQGIPPPTCIIII